MAPPPRAPGAPAGGLGGRRRQPLAGTKWRVARVGHTAIARSYHARLDFKATRANGYDGCNWFGADYRVRGERLRFTNNVSTGVGCDAPRSVMGPVYNARGYRITARKLELLGRRGRTLAVLKRR